MQPAQLGQLLGGQRLRSRNRTALSRQRQHHRSSRRLLLRSHATARQLVLGVLLLHSPSLLLVLQPGAADACNALRQLAHQPQRWLGTRRAGDRPAGQRVNEVGAGV